MLFFYIYLSFKNFGRELLKGYWYLKFFLNLVKEVVEEKYLVDREGVVFKFLSEVWNLE